MPSFQGLTTLRRGLPPRAYRLIDALCQPHPQLDGLYSSLEEALGDAVSWLENQGAAASSCLIGLEVSTASGDWRLIRLPMLLLCPLPSGGEQPAY